MPASSAPKHLLDSLALSDVRVLRANSPSDMFLNRNDW